jgi:hypothetical protein
MKDVTQEQRWIIQMTQAQNFARRDQHADAAARAASVRTEVARAVEGETDPTRRARLERLLLRVDRQLAQFRAGFEAWRGAIEAKRQERIHNAPEEMSRPLPNPPPPR